LLFSKALSTKETGIPFEVRYGSDMLIYILTAIAINFWTRQEGKHYLRRRNRTLEHKQNTPLESLSAVSRPYLAVRRLDMILVNISKFSSERNTPPVYVSNAHTLTAVNEDVDVFRNGDIRRRELLFAQFLILNPKSRDKASFGVFELSYSRSDELDGCIDAKLAVSIGPRVECNKVFGKPSAMAEEESHQKRGQDIQ
jgi:hypothetical protein